MQLADDISNEYMAAASQRSNANDIEEFKRWAASFEGEDAGQSKTLVDTAAPPSNVPSRPLPAPKPSRVKTDDSLGRVDPEKGSAAGSIMRNLGEIIPQAAAGVDQAVHNALSFIDPLANWLDENVLDTRYSPIDQPKTMTGAVTRKLSEFLTGFVPALKGLRTLGMTGNVGAPMLAGAIADFAVRDPHEGRLADLWKEANLPDNILTDYLASDPTDSAVEARFKNAAEGVFVGGALEGVLLGARALRSAKRVRGASKTEQAVLEAKYGTLTDESFNGLGSMKAPVVDFDTKIKKLNQSEYLETISGYGDKKLAAWMRTITEKGNPILEYSDKKLAAFGRTLIEDAKKTGNMKGLGNVPIDTTDPRSLIRGKGLPEDFEVYINFAKIDEPDQVKFVIGKMAEKMKGSIDEARRGVMTVKEMESLADDVGMTVSELLARRKGQPFNAEQAISARRLWAASGEKLLELAKKANGPNAGPVDHFNFRKMMAVHGAIQAEVIGARTETARALRSWAIPQGGTERARAINQVLEASGGTTTSKELARRLSILAENGVHPSFIGKIAERSLIDNSVDALREVWVNGLLSSPKTHVVNITSNTLVAFQQIYERGAAGAIRQFTGGEGVVPGEATAMAFGMIESVKDAFRMAAKALKTGETSWAFNKVDFPKSNALSAESFRMSKETGLGRFVDFLGSAARVPSRLLGAEDEFFKTIGYRMELRAQALRNATQEGHKGPALADRVRQILDDPPEHIRIGAADSALYNTFTNDVGSFGRGIMNLRNIDSPLNPAMFVLPFVRTPVNIARYAFERSPFAPLVGQWRADIAAGGARADLALARMSTGTAIMMTALDLADSGIISGAGPKSQEDRDVREAMMRSGWQEYSIKIGDRWYSYNRTDPFGMTVGLAASIAETVRKGEIDEDDVDEWYEVMAMSIAAVAQVAVSKTYLEGVAKVVEVISDPKRYSQSYVQDLIASFTPLTSLSAAVENVADPVQREANSPWEAVQARVIGLSKNLPPRRNLWGEELRNESQLGKIYDFASPVASRPEDVEPVDREIVRLGAGPQRIKKKTVFDGVEANLKFYPKVYDDYTRLAGNDLKHPAFGMGAKDYLNAVVSGKHPMSASYQIMSDVNRRAFIEGTISDFRKLAQREILSNPQHKNFAAEIAQLKQIHLNSKMPVLE